MTHFRKSRIFLLFLTISYRYRFEVIYVVSGALVQRQRFVCGLFVSFYSATWINKTIKSFCFLHNLTCAIPRLHYYFGRSQVHATSILDNLNWFCVTFVNLVSSSFEAISDFFVFFHSLQSFNFSLNVFVSRVSCPFPVLGFFFYCWDLISLWVLDIGFFRLSVQSRKRNTVHNVRSSPRRIRTFQLRPGQAHVLRTQRKTAVKERSQWAHQSFRSERTL